MLASVSLAGLGRRSPINGLFTSGLEDSEVETFSVDEELIMLDIDHDSLMYLGNLAISSSVFRRKSLMLERSNFNLLPPLDEELSVVVVDE